MFFEELFTSDAINEALDYLSTRKDSCGIDGILLSELREHWEINGNDILEMLDRETYEPGTVRMAEIINNRGKKRKIALYNSTDRLLLRCISQKLQGEYDDLLDEHCFAYRIGKGVEAAVSKAADYYEEGYLWVVKADIQHFFDSIMLDRMNERIKETITDAKIRRLIIKYLYIQIEDDGEFNRKTVGLIQGSPLSPLLSNLYLTPFDKRMTEEGKRFCRFGDDILLFFNRPEEAGDCYEMIENLLLTEYGLHVNEEKSGIFEGFQQRYLGYSFYKDKKSGKVTAQRKQRKPETVFRSWNRGVIRRVDRSYHIINDGILSRKDYNMLFENEEGKRYIPVETAQAINIYSNVVFSSEFFRFIGSKEIDVNIFDRYGNSIGYFAAGKNGYKGKTMLKQAELYLDDGRRLSAARALEIGALHNLRSNIRYYAKHKPSRTLPEGVQRLSEMISEMNNCQKLDGMMLIEARARELYYSLFREIITEEDFQFVKRSRRPPKDPLNAMISFGNVFLYNRVAMEINKTSLDIRVGIIHSTNSRSQSLNLDIAEIFKPLVVDRAIFTLINKKMISADEHFTTVEGEGIYLNSEGKRLFIHELDEKLYQKTTDRNHPISYDTRIREEVSKIFRMIMYGEKYKPFKYQ